jgi:cold shock CspA family protein
MLGRPADTRALPSSGYGGAWRGVIGGKDLFVHRTGINATGFMSPAEGATVSYEPEDGDKGPKAVNVSAL